MKMVAFFGTKRRSGGVVWERAKEVTAYDLGLPDPPTGDEIMVFGAVDNHFDCDQEITGAIVSDAIVALQRSMNNDLDNWLVEHASSDAWF